jgi:4-hydroxy 2-oxovalerate aldolase
MGIEMETIKIFDATLRDGSHAIAHQYTEENIRDYCRAMDGAGMDAIVVGHGNGLGASSLQVGLSLLSDSRMLQIARENLKQTRLAAFMMPGYGTIRDDLAPAVDAGVDVFKVGCHCTETNITRQHIEFLAGKGKEVYGVMMMYHLADRQTLLKQALQMESYGVQGVILMDSAGASTPEMVRDTVGLLHEKLSCSIGFHAHNNLGLAVANTYTAIQSGATVIDGTIRGFGAGAGNCQLEAIVALLKKEGIACGADLYRMMDASEDFVAKWWKDDRGLDDINIVNGMAGVFSGFRRHVENAAACFGVDARDILMELGRRKAVAGQEDMIVEIAKEFQDLKKSGKDKK